MNRAMTKILTYTSMNFLEIHVSFELRLTDHGELAFPYLAGVV
jgi:hypothetical protein